MLGRKEIRKKRIRAKIKGTSQRPRLSVFRSNKLIYAQIINDEKGDTILGVSEKNIDKKVSGSKIDQAKILGLFLAKKATAKKIKNVIFDRGSYKYHGRIKALAEGAREGGLVF
ncbi:MAG: 50S ribosomal protein L18 [Candidatus Levybacteria bacterium]|nr:50S ribosomal protein L18 [Candidatus Levybacteria bacterium]